MQTTAQKIESESVYINDLETEIDELMLKLQYSDINYQGRTDIINKMKEKREQINKSKALIKKLERKGK